MKHKHHEVSHQRSATLKNDIGEGIDPDDPWRLIIAPNIAALRPKTHWPTGWPPKRKLMQFSRTAKTSKSTDAES